MALFNAMVSVAYETRSGRKLMSKNATFTNTMNRTVDTEMMVIM